MGAPASDLLQHSIQNNHSSHTSHSPNRPSGHDPRRDHCHVPVISLDHVSFGYGQKQVIRDLSFTVLERDFVGLIGPNGAGKTTLLKLIAGLIRPNRGDIRLFGQPARQFRNWHRIGYVPQRSNINALFPATVYEVVLSGLYGRRTLFRRLDRDARQKCEEALAALGVEDLAGRLIGKLSGGQQQRVLLARALINNPDLLILDEPTTGIDAEAQEAFFHMIRHMHRHHNITFVMVSHDVNMMLSYLGNEPRFEYNGIRFFVRHSHDLDECRETNLTHTLKAFQEQMRSAGSAAAGEREPVMSAAD